MPNILFASNNIAHFQNSNAGSVVGTYDDTRVPYSIALTDYELVQSPVFTGAVGDETWFHFRTFANSVEYSRADTYFQAYDANDNLLFQLNKRNATYSHLTRSYLYDGATTIQTDSTIPMTNNRENTVDIKYVAQGLLILLEVYVNGALTLSAQFNSNPNGYGDPVRFVIGAGFVDNASNVQHYSEIIVADGDTRNARLNLLRPNAAGANEDWDGQLAVLADDDTTTGLTTIAADQRQSMLMTAYTGAANISNFVTVSSTTRGQNSPTQLQHTIRLSGIDYDGPLHAIGFPLEFQITDYNVNPATSLPWTSADLIAIETGFVSRA